MVITELIDRVQHPAIPKHYVILIVGVFFDTERDNFFLLKLFNDKANVSGPTYLHVM